MKHFCKFEIQVMRRHIETGKPAIEHMAIVFDRCHFEILDYINDMRRALGISKKRTIGSDQPIAVQPTVKLLDKAVEEKKKYYLQTRELEPSKVKAPKGKKLGEGYPIKVPKDLDGRVKRFERPKAVYTNKNHIEAALNVAI